MDSRIAVERMQIWVTFQVEGFHRWPEAPDHRAYLREEHRHLFHYRVQIEVFHEDREIEFHDFLDFCRANALGGSMGRKSCEDMAHHLAGKIKDRWGQRSLQRSLFVTVSEDGEAGATCEYLV